MAEQKSISLYTAINVSDIEVFSQKYMGQNLEPEDRETLRVMMEEHLDNYADMVLLENSGCIGLIRIWGKVKEILGRPMTDTEKEIIKEKYLDEPICGYEPIELHPIISWARTLVVNKNF
jgi:hypothetical protein